VSPLLLAMPLWAATWRVGADAASVQEAVDAAAPGDTILLPPGDWPGPVVLDRPLTLSSEGGPEQGGTLVGDGDGHVLVVDAPGARVVGLSLRRSGVDRVREDACILVRGADALVQGNRMRECLYGIAVRETTGAQVLDNEVDGRPDIRPADRGNGIHLFGSTHLVVRGNTVRQSRDGIYVSATHDSRIEDNDASEQRYGIHYMWAHRNVVTGNHTHHNNGGIALMESRDLVVVGNEASDNRRHGILFRDVERCRIEANRVERNTEGMFFFGALDNTIRGNRIAGNQIGARIWTGNERNRIADNDFVGNRSQVLYVSLRDEVWEGEAGRNHWSDHLGWDQDGDGLGDRPYRVDSLLAGLLYRAPAAVLLLSSPTLELLRQAQALLPALRVPTITDTQPRMRAHAQVAP
jgi:nitrous oxidase accessory protein